MAIELSLTEVAPMYNLVLVIIATVLFIKLFALPKKDRRAYTKPWIYIFIGMMLFLIITILTILRMQGIIDIPIHINGFFELVIIILFIYSLLLQEEFMNKI